MDLDAWRLQGHDEHRDALVLGRAGVGARQQQDMAGEIGATGEHLLAVDDPPVAVAYGAGLRREHIRARRRLGVAEAGDGVARAQ